MIDLHTEHLLSLPAAVKALPRTRTGKATHIATVYRWISRGIRGVRLESIRVGGALYTSREAIQRFADRLTGSGAVRDPAPRRTELQPDTDAKLDRFGL